MFQGYSCRMGRIYFSTSVDHECKHMMSDHKHLVTVAAWTASVDTTVSNPPEQED